jgi:hypothetical protein
MRKILLTILSLAFMTCLSVSAQMTPDSIQTDHYKTKQFDCVIFPDNYIDLIGGERFTPSRNEVDQAEKALIENLEELNNPLINQGGKYNPIIHKNLKKYNRQYFGYIDKNGDKILLINCFWRQKNRFDNWTKERVMVFDGGSHYWSIKLNLTTGKLFDLSVNGIA